MINSDESEEKLNENQSPRTSIFCLSYFRIFSISISAKSTKENFSISSLKRIQVQMSNKKINLKI
jgi:hypothetical protein